jgi:hypothetical protein
MTPQRAAVSCATAVYLTSLSQWRTFCSNLLPPFSHLNIKAAAVSETSQHAHKTAGRPSIPTNSRPSIPTNSRPSIRTNPYIRFTPSQKLDAAVPYSVEGLSRTVGVRKLSHMEKPICFWGPPSLLLNGDRVKTRSEVNHSTLSNVKIKNEWS